GAIVKLKGEHDADTKPGSYGAASLITKVRIILAGVFMNLITALAVLTILALIGMPKLFPNQFTFTGDTKVIKDDVMVGFVEEGSPADKAGIQTRDTLTAFINQNGEAIAIDD